MASTAKIAENYWVDKKLKIWAYCNNINTFNLGTFVKCAFSAALAVRN